MDKLAINDFNTWDICEKGFFLSKSDESGTVYIGINQLKDVLELLNRTKSYIKKQNAEHRQDAEVRK